MKKETQMENAIIYPKGPPELNPQTLSTWPLVGQTESRKVESPEADIAAQIGASCREINGEGRDAGKHCPKCDSNKLLSMFFVNKSNKDGRQRICKACKKEIDKKWLSENPKYHKEYDKQRYEIKGPHKANRDNLKKVQKRADAKRRSTPKGKLTYCLSWGIRDSLKRGTKSGRHWESLVDFTIDQLKTHLGKLFKPGMTWENYGEWHIDHKIPIAAFNFNKPEDLDFKRCWTLKNLQPLWAKENMSKHAKVNKPFQPSLTI